MYNHKIDLSLFMPPVIMGDLIIFYNQTKLYFIIILNTFTKANK